MLDASFRFQSLFDVAREHRDPGDFSFPAVELPIRIESALERMNGTGTCFRLNTARKNGREICVPKDYETALLLRRLNENIRRMTNARQTDRSYVVSCLKQLLGNGMPFVVAKYDIQKFYASIDRSVLRDACYAPLKSSGTTRKMLDRYLSDLKLHGISGVPAGLALSGTLSEVILSKFDKAIARSEGVHFYSRYVDDIIIVAAPDTTDSALTQLIVENLPLGLQINTAPEKKDFVELKENVSRRKASDQSFNYLGYNFNIAATSPKANHDRTLSARKVALDISPSKIKKRKTRFILSLQQYFRDGNQDDLMDRFLLINSGYKFYDRSSGRWQSSGMCNSYPLVDFPSPALNELASFYRSVLHSPTSQFSARLSLAPLTRRNKKRILYMDLCSHVQKKKYVGFSDQRLSALMGVWRRA